MTDPVEQGLLESQYHRRMHALYRVVRAEMHTRYGIRPSVVAAEIRREFAAQVKRFTFTPPPAPAPPPVKS